MSAFTKGPWEYRPGIFDDWGVVRCEAGFICQARNPAIGFAEEQVHRSAKTDPAEANGRLIAAAPDMYEALKATLRELTACANQLDALGYPSRDGGSVRSAQEQARAALAKAVQK